MKLWFRAKYVLLCHPRPPMGACVLTEEPKLVEVGRLAGVTRLLRRKSGLRQTWP